jgi:hypothetical protein
VQSARNWQAHEPGFWTLYQRLVFLGQQRSHVVVDFAQLRERFAGSYLWPLLLTNLIQRTLPAHDHSLRLQVAQAQVASARALHSRSMLINGLTHLADAQRFVQDLAGALRTMEEAFQALRQVGWESTAIEVRVRTAELHWRVLALEPARRCLQEAQALDTVGFELDASTLVVHRAIVLMLSQQHEDAAREMRALPAEKAHKVPDNDLVEWAEALALMCLHRGQTNAAAELATALRELDTVNRGLPDIEHFRDQRFGARPQQPHTGSDADSANPAQLRVWLSKRVEAVHRAL